MLRLPDTEIEEAHAEKLLEWQTLVNAKPSFPEQVEEAKKQFKTKNTKSNQTFVVVRSSLAKMHGDLIRCAYCEDSVADEVEHLFPKDIYPERVFSWKNYAYACGPCNGPKSNNFSIFRTADGLEINVTPPKPKPLGWVHAPPPPGDALLINPREEDPLNFLWLDLHGTYRIEPKLGLHSKEHRRAEYTRDLLNLNRDFLIRARKNALIAAWDTFQIYSQLKISAAGAAELDKRRDAIKTMVHRTVWKEMIRQRAQIPPLNSLFESNPEALDW